MDLAHEKKSFLNKFKEADSQDSINSLKIEYLGKKGVLSSLMSQLSNAPAEKKPKLGKSINKFKSLVEESIDLVLDSLRILVPNEPTNNCLCQFPDPMPYSLLCLTMI